MTKIQWPPLTRKTNKPGLRLKQKIQSIQSRKTAEYVIQRCHLLVADTTLQRSYIVVATDPTSFDKAICLADQYLGYWFVFKIQRLDYHLFIADDVMISLSESTAWGSCNIEQQRRTIWTMPVQVRKIRNWGCKQLESLIFIKYQNLITKMVLSKQI